MVSWRDPRVRRARTTLLLVLWLLIAIDLGVSARHDYRQEHDLEGHQLVEFGYGLAAVGWLLVLLVPVTFRLVRRRRARAVGHHLPAPDGAPPPRPR